LNENEEGNIRKREQEERKRNAFVSNKKEIEKESKSHKL
jgi:hypothetical protein